MNLSPLILMLASIVSSPAAIAPADADLSHPPLPEAVASFGAAVVDDDLYVYGGHVGRAHRHSRENLASGFYRLDLSERDEWESLPMQTQMQGLALVAHDGFVYRIGGLRAHNEPDELEDLESVAEVARFDVRTGTWESLPPLPEPRSSHDAVVYDDKLYVIGGWTLLGDADTDETRWLDTAWVADLRADTFVWSPVPEPPFRRRALATAAANGVLVVIGGIDDDGHASRAVDLFDVESGTWSQGPEFPIGGRLKAFGASAFGIGSRIFASSAEGRVVALLPGEDHWVETGVELQTPRFFHRLLAHENRRMLFVGGAGKETGHLSCIETYPVETQDRTRPRPAHTETKIEATIESPRRSESGESTAPACGDASVWPGFRGDGTSRTSAVALPVTWDENTLRWSVEVRGYGQSSPVVWRDKVFVTSVDGENKETLVVTCLDALSGETRWERTFEASTTRKSSDMVSRAAPTPVVDAHRVYAFFEGGDLVALDHDGATVWQRSLAGGTETLGENHGLASSLVATPHGILLLVDHAGPSYLLHIDRATGKDLWKVDRESRVSWSTPLVVSAGERDDDPRIITSSDGSVECLRLADGSRIWHVTGLDGNTIPSPSYEDEIVFVGSSKKNSNVAIRADGEGDVTSTHVLWRSPDALVSFGSPLVHRGRAYAVNRAGVARALDLETGDEVWTQRIGASCWASPIAAGDRVYFFDKDGRTMVFDVRGDAPVVIADNTISNDEPVYGVAAVHGAFFVRSGSRVYCIGVAPRPA